MQELKKCFGIISYLPDIADKRVARISGILSLVSQLEEFWPTVDILIIAQNWKDFELPETKNTKIIKHYSALGVVGARKTLRTEFLKLSYDYIILFDDDAVIKCDNNHAHIDYMAEIDKHPDGFCFIHSERHWHRWDDYAMAPLNLCAISRQIYEAELIPNIDPEKDQLIEDDIYAILLHAKYTQKEFLPPTTIHHIQYTGFDKNTTWVNNSTKENFNTFMANTNKLLDHILRHKSLPSTFYINNVVCAIAKNENIYINEWCKYYLDLGFSHIYLYDNNAPETPYVGDYINKDILDKITIIKWKDSEIASLTQLNAYTDFYTKYGNTFDWCFICDIDEFLVGVSDVNAWLLKESFNNFDIIRIKWRLFGDDNIVERDRTIPVHKFFKKQILGDAFTVLTKYFIRGGLSNIEFINPHLAKNSDNTLVACLPSGKSYKNQEKLENSIDYTEETIFLNHYITKTLSEFLDYKYTRMRLAVSNQDTIGNLNDIAYFWRYNEKTEQKVQYFNNYIKNGKSKMEETVKLKKCFGIISYLPDGLARRSARIRHLNNLLNQLSLLWPNIDILIITQNWKDYIPPEVSNTIIRYDFDTALKITGARKVLREKFLELDYDYIIMLDDDARIYTANNVVASEYIKKIDENPGGFCFIHSTNHWRHHDDIARSPLNLCAISRELYEKEELPEVDIEKQEAMEDDIYATIFHIKYADKEFYPPEGIYHLHSFKGMYVKFYADRQISAPTWFNSVAEIHFYRIWHNTNQAIEYIETNKDFDLQKIKETMKWIM